MYIVTSWTLNDFTVCSWIPYFISFAISVHCWSFWNFAYLRLHALRWLLMHIWPIWFHTNGCGHISCRALHYLYKTDCQLLSVLSLAWLVFGLIESVAASYFMVRNHHCRTCSVRWFISFTVYGALLGGVRWNGCAWTGSTRPQKFKCYRRYYIAVSLNMVTVIGQLHSGNPVKENSWIVV